MRPRAPDRPWPVPWRRPWRRSSPRAPWRAHVWQERASRQLVEESAWRRRVGRRRWPEPRGRPPCWRRRRRARCRPSPPMRRWRPRADWPLNARAAAVAAEAESAAAVDGKSWAVEVTLTGLRMSRVAAALYLRAPTRPRRCPRPRPRRHHRSKRKFPLEGRPHLAAPLHASSRLGLVVIKLRDRRRGSLVAIEILPWTAPVPFSEHWPAPDALQFLCCRPSP